MGIGLVLTALVLVVTAVVLWQAETDDTDNEAQAREYAEAISGQPFDDPEPDRTAPLALGAASAVLVLGGIVLVASPSPDS